MRNRFLVKKKTAESFGVKFGDYVYVTKVNELYVISKEPAIKTRRIKVDKYNNIRFDVKINANNIAVFPSNIVVG